MPDVCIRIRPDGPLVIEGPISLVDQNGQPFAWSNAKGNVALCRCGHTNTAPFCDGSHKRCGYQSQPLAVPRQ